MPTICSSNPGIEGAGTDFELIAFGSAAFELLIAHESRKIEGYDIALTNGTILNGCFGCHLVELFLNLCGNFFVRNIIFNNGCFYSLVFAEFDRRGWRTTSAVKLTPSCSDTSVNSMFG